MAPETQLNKGFQLIWKQSIHCDCGFNDLFENQLQLSEGWD
jgi:hypothetical protein